MGIIAVNAASIKPLFSSQRWLASSKGNSAPPNSNGNNSHPLVTIGSSAVAPRHSHRRSLNYTDIDNSSEEQIFKPDLSHLRKDTMSGETKVTADSSTRKGTYPGGITVTTQVDVDDNKTRLYV